MKTYTLVVIGAGSGGLSAARFAASLNASVALVEKHRIGGDCTWTGCVPSKALIKAAKMAHMARSGVDYGVSAENVKVDMKKVKEYVSSTIQDVYKHENQEEQEKMGVEVLRGRAEFQDRNTVTIHPSPDGAQDSGGDNKSQTPYQIRGKFFLLCTGAEANMPAFVRELAKDSSQGILTYETLFDVEKLPKSLGVLGGGPIGAEIAQAYQRFGCQVSIFASAIMPKEEASARKVVLEVFQQEGIRHVSGRATTLARDPTSGTLSVGTASGESVEVEAVLVATGRSAFTKGLNLDKVGIKVDPKTKGIWVDSLLRTSVKNVYAAGDCTGTVHQFTHMAAQQAGIAVRNMLLPGSQSTPLTAPRVTFTDPEVAQVGLTEAEAKQMHGDKLGVVRRELRGQVERAMCEHEGNGFIQIMYLKPSTKILGATVVCSRAGEIMQELAVAMAGKVTLKNLATIMHAYPSFSFAIQEMASSVLNETLKEGFMGWLIRSCMAK